MNGISSFGRRARWWVVPVLLVTVLGIARKGAADMVININPGPGLADNQAALDAFERAAAAWSSRIADDIVVNIAADLEDLGTGSTLGRASSSVFYATEPNEFRDVMIADAADEPDDGIVAFLPDMPDFTAILPDGFSLARLPEHQGGHVLMRATKANLKALGFAGSLLDFHDGGAPDGTIAFNTNFSFDFDNSNGVAPGKFDFESAAAHEIGHTLGFISTVDRIDVLMDASQTDTVYPTTLDAFRFEDDAVGHDPSTAADFELMPRYLSPGGNAITDQIWGFGQSDAETPMSTGSNEGNGNQASHWLDDALNGGVMVGMMDPRIASGQIFSITDSDLRALDLIGYEIDMPEAAADLNGDVDVDILDVNALTNVGDLSVGVAVPPADAKFDLTGDGIVDSADLDQWLAHAATISGHDSPYLRGDANLDGDVDIWQFDGSGDAQLLSNHLSTTTGMVWGNGDFNGDGDVDVWQFDGSGDAQLLSSNLNAPHDIGAAVVPEPTTLALLAMGTVGLFARGRRRRKAV